MKKLLLIIGCSFTICAQAQLKQKLNTFHVIDNETKAPVPSTTVTILRAKLSITTEANGVFIIPGNLSMMKDTVIFSAQNYLQLKIPLNKLDNLDTIPLNKSTVKTNATFLKYDTEAVLNKYNSNEINHYAGVNSETAIFNYLQLAQKFEAPRSGVRLKNVIINRLVFDSHFENGVLSEKDFIPTVFRLRIYDVDSKTGGPGEDLCKDIIEIKNGDRSESPISLSKYNIITINKTFFVAIEWKRDFSNLDHSLVYNRTANKTDTLKTYRPIIGISPIAGKKVNIWSLSIENNWKPYTYFSPFGTELAIKATVEY